MVMVRIGIVTAVAAFLLLLPGVSPVAWWLDSGELSAAAVELGVPHPPGVPGWAHLGRLAAALPIGALGFRVALASAACAAAACGLVADLLRRHRLPAPAAFVLALWPLSNPTFVRAARIAEIYAFGTLLAVYVVWALDPRWGRGRADRMRLCGAFVATWAALGYGDLRLAFAPWFLGLFVLAVRRRARIAAWLPVVAAMALGTALAVLLAARREPVAAWGDPTNLGGLVDHLTARSIRESFATEILPASAAAWREAATRFATRMADDLGPMGLAIAGWGLVTLPFAGRRPRTAALGRLLAWIVVVHTFYAIGINPMGEADRQTGIVIAPVAAMAAGLVLARFVGRLGRARWAVLPLALAMIVLPPALGSFHEAKVTATFAPRHWTAAAVDQIPEGGLLLTQSDDLAAGLRMMRVAEGLPPGVRTIPAQHLYRPPMGAASHDPVIVRLHRAARRGANDAERVRAVTSVHEGPVALEHPGSGLFEGIAGTGPPSGRLPVGFVVGHGVAAEGPLADVRGAWMRLEPLLATYEDRRRFADAATRRIALWIEVAGGLGLASADLLTDALSAGRFVLETVDPDHAHAYAVVAAIFDRLGDRRRAVEAARAALARAPAGERALSNLALYLSRAGPGTAEHAEAIVLLARAVALRPHHDRPWDALANLLAAEGDAVGARLARARDPAVLDHVGRIYGARAAAP
ncbi:MAG: DUF2723 domain-containing protein [Deltaproteobacteria bacterium]|nr:MAG: DUF2723 domain-containing protein [Deltaproteobacteria bacterium]